jgi:hypothetical protein
VFALLHAAQAGAHVVAGAACRRVVGQPLATGFKLVKGSGWACAWPQVRSAYAPMFSKSASARRERRNVATRSTTATLED